jgi:GNAT superfamily N-acetyltransferase
MTTVRIATPTDLPALVVLLSELFSIEVDFSPDTAKQRRGLELLLDAGERACVLVAEEAGQVVGMVTAQILISTAEGADVALIEDMVVTQSARGRGIGQRLLAEIESWCAERGLARLQLLADRQNTPASEFYQRCGWLPTQMVAWRKFPPST